MFKKILIANRGEIARRIIAAVKEMGIATIAIYSDPDQNALRTAHLGHRANQGRQVVTPVRPVRSLPEILVITVIHAVIMRGFRRAGKSFTA